MERRQLENCVGARKPPCFKQRPSTGRAWGAVAGAAQADKARTPLQIVRLGPLIRDARAPKKVKTRPGAPPPQEPAPDAPVAEIFNSESVRALSASDSPGRLPDRTCQTPDASTAGRHGCLMYISAAFLPLGQDWSKWPAVSCLAHSVCFLSWGQLATFLPKPYSFVRALFRVNPLSSTVLLSFSFIATIANISGRSQV